MVTINKDSYNNPINDIPPALLRAALDTLESWSEEDKEHFSKNPSIELATKLFHKYANK